MAKYVKLGNGKCLPLDLVVLCNGPEAPYHIADTLGVILPNVQGQGYAFDIAYDDLKHHHGLNVLMSDSIYSCGQYTPGRHRHSACVDLGMFKKPNYDDNRFS